MELKIPPVAVFLLCALLMFLLHSLNILIFTFKGAVFTAVVFGVLGAVVVALALRLFRKADTTVDPMHPGKSSSLISSGIYRYTRNPMYLAMFLILVGVFFYFGSWLNIAVLLFFIRFMTQYQIKPEEKMLSKIYGDTYVEYCKNVRRWL